MTGGCADLCTGSWTRYLSERSSCRAACWAEALEVKNNINVEIPKMKFQIPGFEFALVPGRIIPVLFVFLYILIIFYLKSTVDLC